MKSKKGTGIVANRSAVRSGKGSLRYDLIMGKLPTKNEGSKSRVFKVISIKQIFEEILTERPTDLPTDGQRGWLTGKLNFHIYCYEIKNVLVLEY